MIKKLLIILLIITSYLLYAEDPEKILLTALQNSILDGTFITLEEPLVYLTSLSFIEGGEYDESQEAIIDNVNLEIFNSDGDSFQRLFIPIYSITEDLSKSRYFLYTRETQYFSDPITGKLYQASTKASLYERDYENKLSLKDKYTIQDFKETTFKDTPCYFISIFNKDAKSTTNFYIEKARNLRLREDYFETYPILTQRTEYLSYQEIIPDIYIEKKYSLWTINFPRSIRLYEILDPTFKQIPKEFFSEDILLKL